MKVELLMSKEQEKNSALCKCSCFIRFSSYLKVSKSLFGSKSEETLVFLLVQSLYNAKNGRILIEFVKKY